MGIIVWKFKVYLVIIVTERDSIVYGVSQKVTMETSWGKICMSFVTMTTTYPQYVLQFDGRGSYQFKKIDPSEEEFGS